MIQVIKVTGSDLDKKLNKVLERLQKEEGCIIYQLHIYDIHTAFIEYKQGA